MQAPNPWRSSNYENKIDLRFTTLRLDAKNGDGECSRYGRQCARHDHLRTSARRRKPRRACSLDDMAANIGGNPCCRDEFFIHIPRKERRIIL